MKQNNGLGSTAKDMTQALGRIGGVAGFGLSVVTPLVVCILLAVWLKNRYGLEDWIMVVAVVVGLISSACGAYRSIKAFVETDRRRDAKKNAENPPVKPKRDPNEAWHVGESHKNHDENNFS